MKQHIVGLDPYNEIDLAEVDEQIKEIEKQEEYNYEQHAQFLGGEIHQNQFEKIVEER